MNWCADMVKVEQWRRNGNISCEIYVCLHEYKYAHAHFYRLKANKSQDIIQAYF